MSKASENLRPGSAERQLGMRKEWREGSQAGTRRSQGDPGAQSVGLGWYSRGYLPHADFPERLQSITYHLADSLPAEALARIGDQLRLVGPNRREAERRKNLDAWLDAGHGSCVLQDPRAASCIIENWRHFAGERYDLIAWVVMPNHVHVLIRVYGGMTLQRIVQSWKTIQPPDRRVVRLARASFWHPEDGYENAELALGDPRKDFLLSGRGSVGTGMFGMIGILLRRLTTSTGIP